MPRISPQQKHGHPAEAQQQTGDDGELQAFGGQCEMGHHGRDQGNQRADERHEPGRGVVQRHIPGIERHQHAEYRQHQADAQLDPRIRILLLTAAMRAKTAAPEMIEEPAAMVSGPNPSRRAIRTATGDVPQARLMTSMTVQIIRFERSTFNPVDPLSTGYFTPARHASSTSPIAERPPSATGYSRPPHPMNAPPGSKRTPGPSWAGWVTTPEARHQGRSAYSIT